MAHLLLLHSIARIAVSCFAAASCVVVSIIAPHARVVSLATHELTLLSVFFPLSLFFIFSFIFSFSPAPSLLFSSLTSLCLFSLFYSLSLSPSPPPHPSPASAAAPEEDDTRTSLGGLLWLRVGRRLRTQVRVAGAFRTAGNIARLRRRTSRLASHALGGPAARAPRRLSDHTVLQTQGLPAPSPARAMWRTAVARLRYQIRVVNAFRNVLPAAEARSMLTTSQPVTPLLEESGQQQQGGADMAGVERQP